MAKSAAVVGTELGPSKNNMGLPLTDVAALAEREQLAEEQAMDAMLAQLRAGGAVPFNEQTMDGIGRFAHIHDPEGNAVELWEPAG